MLPIRSRRVCSTGVKHAYNTHLTQRVSKQVTFSLVPTKSIQSPLCSIAGTSAFTGSMITVNQSAPRESLGKVNGVGQQVAAFVRAAAPALGGYVWSLGLQTGIQGQQFLVFSLIAIGGVSTQFLYAWFPHKDS